MADHELSADFILGPWASITDVLEEVSIRHTGGRLRVATAWANDAGARWLIDSLGGRIGQMEFVVGMNSKLTTVEGLIRILENGADSLHLYYRHPQQIFHPKFYWFTGGDSDDGLVSLIVGSSNLTNGGLSKNIEASLVLSGTSDDDGIRPAVARVGESWDELLSSEFAHGIDDAAQLERFYKLGRILSEKTLSRMRRTAAKAAEEAPDEGDEEQPEGLPIGELPESSVPAMGSIEVPFEIDEPEQESGSPGLIEPAPEAAEPLGELPTVTGTSFVMTLQQTDVGVGQTSAGTSRRSPEIFIPLAARDANPSFWGWPGQFVDDPAIPGKKDRQARIILDGEVHEATIWFNPDKHDIRIRAEALRSAGDVGDILLLQEDGPNADYVATIADAGSRLHDRLLAKCDMEVKAPSQKRFGYF